MDFTFGFERGFLLVAAVRNILDAKIAQNLVEVRGVGEHVLYGEGLHGALSARALAGFFPSAQVKSVIGAALVTQARRVVVMEWRGGGGAVGAVEVYQKEGRKTELWVKEERFCPGLRALPRRCAALCCRCALTCGRAAFLRDQTAFSPPPKYKMKRGNPSSFIVCKWQQLGGAVWIRFSCSGA